MAEDFSVRGASQFDELARRMRAAGEGDLLKELTKSLRVAVKPVTPAARAEARRRLPRAGGLAERVARAPQRITARAGATTTSVRLTVAGKKSGAAGADAGLVRHPVFGRGRTSFVEQRVPAGWFTDTVEGQREGLQSDVIKVLEKYTQHLAARLRGSHGGA